MPVTTVSNHNWERVRQYRPPLPAGLYDWNDNGLDILRGLRRNAERDVQETALLQRSLGRSPLSRDARDLLRFWQRQVKAIGLVIDWIAGKASDRRFDNWPIELAAELDEAFNAFEFGACRRLLAGVERSPYPSQP